MIFTTYNDNIENKKKKQYFFIINYHNNNNKITTTKKLYNANLLFFNWLGVKHIPIN